MQATEVTPLYGTRPYSHYRTIRLQYIPVVLVTVALLIATSFYFQSHDDTSFIVPLALSVDGTEWFCQEREFETDYIQLSNKKEDYYFYWFVPSRSTTPDTDPLVIWLNGGPGSSSLEGLFAENGPCLVQANLSIQSNPYAWNNNAHVIWVDQPSGVGFSYFTNDDDRDATGEDVGANMIAFLDGFLNKHPEFIGRPFFLTGESYAGHYIPAIAHRIWQKNKMNKLNLKRMNLQGIALANSDPNLPLQYKYYVKMATENNYNLTLLNTTQIQQMIKDSEECSHRLVTCQPFAEGTEGCLAAANFCGYKMLGPYVGAGRNIYNILEICTSEIECYWDGGAVEPFLKSDVVTKALYPTVQGRVWGTSGSYVSEMFLSSGDWGRSYAKEIAELLNDGLRVLVFAGDADLVCNWISNRAWTLALDWRGKDRYNAATERPFIVPIDPLRGDVTKTTVAGSVWQYENLVFVRVSGAGHLVPRNQPAVAWVLIDRFVKGEAI